jgi:hypothetical protein
MTATLEQIDPSEIVKRALVARCCIAEALTQLSGMAPHPERTAVGHDLLAAYHRLGVWADADGHLGDGS